MISYEFPLNEKVRTWLRLEDLFTRVNHFLSGELSIEHHAALIGSSGESHSVRFARRSDTDCFCQ